MNTIPAIDNQKIQSKYIKISEDGCTKLQPPFEYFRASSSIFQSLASEV
jgi:hypothetical protein